MDTLLEKEATLKSQQWPDKSKYFIYITFISTNVRNYLQKKCICSNYTSVYSTFADVAFDVFIKQSVEMLTNQVAAVDVLHNMQTWSNINEYFISGLAGITKPMLQIIYSVIKKFTTDILFICNLTKIFFLSLNLPVTRKTKKISKRRHDEHARIQIRNSSSGMSKILIHK